MIRIESDPHGVRGDNDFPLHACCGDCGHMNIHLVDHIGVHSMTMRLMGNMCVCVMDTEIDVPNEKISSFSRRILA